MTDQKSPADPPPQYPGPPQGAPPQGAPPQGYPTQQAGYPPQQPGYPPQQPGYPPQQGSYQSGSNVVITQPGNTTVIMTTQLTLGDNPATLTCPNCNNSVTSVVTKEMGLMVWLAAGGMCIIGLWPCACIPFCITDLYDSKHTCPVCKHHLGYHKKLN